jgi:hypothetical protein
MIVFPILHNVLTYHDSFGQLWTPLSCPGGLPKKGLEIRLGNPDQSIDPMRHEKAVLDPSADRAAGDFDENGDLLDRVEFHRRFWLIGFHLPVAPIRV